MDKKVNIYTLNGYANYGNRLQLFALARVIKELGWEPKVYWPKSIKWQIKDTLKRKTPLAFSFPKERKLSKFTKKYIPKSTTRRAGVSVVGSDQVWNPKYLEPRQYLLNVPDDSVKISYAASIGMESFNESQQKMFAKALENYKAISVREQSAKEILQPLVSDKKVEVVLDPTLLIDASTYKSLEKKPKDIDEDEKYILCYILGNRDHQSVIDKYAKENGYKIVIFSDKHDSSYGVEEFLYLIHHAGLICTDSFHACVFSFIFERPFVAFKRTGKENYMYTRLQNLLNIFKLKNREYNGKEITKDNLIVDYAGAKKILAKEQERSRDFLKRSLEVDNEA